MKVGYMYILKCANGAYYTGSTVDLERRLAQHKSGEGANFTKKHLPVELVYCEEYHRIDEAFYREKQVQGWSRAKKEALINSKTNLLNKLSECKNETHYKNYNNGVSTTLNTQEDEIVNRSLSEVEMSEVEMSEVEMSEVEMSDKHKILKK